ncbi:MAG: aminoglycoside phosphotransferase family protein [Clostridia bacterium]|nr:aminoglycoside phosphotransferase family protein [Clostridia bacterium]
MNIPTQTLNHICEVFGLPGEIVSTEIIGNGNINRTYDVLMEDGDIRTRYIFQSINTFVFKQPVGIMQNIARITAHCGEKLRAMGESRDRVMHFMVRDNGDNYYIDGDAFWRVCEFVPNTVAYNASEDPAILRAAGRAFGQFQTMLADFDATLLHETIPNFHNTKQRYLTLDEHIKADPVGRVASVRAEIDTLADMREDALRLCDMLERGELPLRVTHNDTKINNVLFDADTGREKTVIDLDTVMPGLVAYDFGDAIRFAGNRSAEDEKDLSLTGLDMERFTAFTEGFVGELAATLTENERRTLALGVFVMTVELAVRFLDDYICGDQYFKLLYPEHNLVRTRCQIRLAQDVWSRLDQMNDVVETIYKDALKAHSCAQ